MVADPKVWELATCTGTDPIDGVTPDTTTHGGTIESNGAACDGSGDLLIEAGEHVAAQTGATLGEWTFGVKAAGRYQIEFNHDGNGFSLGAGYPGMAARKAVIDFNQGAAYFSVSTPDEVRCSSDYNLSGQFAADSEVFVKIVRSADGTSELWLSDAAITDVESPVALCNYVGNDKGMVFQVRQEANDGLLYLPVTYRSAQQVDTTGPTVPAVSCTNSGLVANCVWSAAVDPVTNSSSMVKWVDVFADTSNPPTTQIAESLAASTATISRTSATPETVYFDLVFSDAAANSTTTTTESVTTTSANSAPVIGTPVAAVVPTGVTADSEIIAIDMVAHCAATDADGDEMHVVSIVTQPADGEAMLRTVNDRRIDYQHARSATDSDSVVVTLGDTTGNVSGNCTVPITPQTPKYVEPIISFPNQSALNVDFNYLIRLGPTYLGEWESETGFYRTWQAVEGTTAANTPVACPVSHPYPCAKVKIYIDELDRNGNLVVDAPAVGEYVTGMFIPLDGPPGYADYLQVKQ